MAAVRRRPASASAGLGTRVVSLAPPSPYARRVLDLVDRIPAGKVMTYGDVAEYLGSGGPRAVGNVMSQHGHQVPWWRVLLSSGHPAPTQPGEALDRLRAEGTPLLAGGARVDLSAARWDGR